MVTTVKIQESTKESLDKIKTLKDSYDDVIKGLVIKKLNKNLNKDLIECYKKTSLRDKKIVNEWEHTYKEIL